MRDEEFRTLPILKDYILIGNYGTIKKIPHTYTRQVNGKQYTYHRYNEKELKQYLMGGRGENRYHYVEVPLSNGTFKQMPVHRLVALAWVDGYFEGAEVNHIDEDKSNNCWDNLEWCTRAYNNAYGSHGYKISIANRKHR